MKAENSKTTKVSNSMNVPGTAKSSNKTNAAERSVTGGRLYEVMERRDISCRELAEKVSVSPSTISGYRNTHRRPDFGILVIIADVLNVSLDYLAGRTDEFRDFR